MPSNILFVVSHPDDEALWCGGLINELNRTKDINAYVLALWGCQHDKPMESGRVDAFLESTKHCKGSYVFENGPKNLNQALSIGLARLELTTSVDLVITHSPDGDEHSHRHHIALFSFLRDWCDNLNIPFGFFSYYMRKGEYSTITNDIWRKNGLHLVNYSKYGSGVYLGFTVDQAEKLRMFQNYTMINQREHINGYRALTSGYEGYYVDERGILALEPLLSTMDKKYRRV